MVNDVRGLFLKINQVDLPYQVFDNLGDVEAVGESDLDVLAPLPVIANQIEDDFELIEVEPAPEPERPHGARKVIASIRQRVFQGFSIPAAEGGKEEIAPAPKAEPEVEIAPVVVAETEAPSAPPPAPVIPAAAPVPLFPPKPAAAPTGGGLLRRYAPAPAAAPIPAPVPAADGETHLKTLFDRLVDRG